VTSSADLVIRHEDETWTRIGPELLPKRLVSAVCCSPDGFVYAATGMPGRVAIYKGRGESWEKLYEDIDKESYADQMRDLVWHDNMLWAARWNEMVILRILARRP